MKTKPTFLPLGAALAALLFITGCPDRPDDPVAPTENDPSVTFEGELRVGRTLTAHSANFPSGTTVYRWQGSDSETGTFGNIAGATGRSFRLTSLQEGKWIRVEVRQGGIAEPSAARGDVEAGEALVRKGGDKPHQVFSGRRYPYGKRDGFSARCGSRLPVGTGVRRRCIRDDIRSDGRNLPGGPRG